MRTAFLVGAVVAAGLGLSGWRAARPPSTQTHLSVGPAAVADPADGGTLRLEGQVQPRSKVSISAGVSLPVVALPFKEGDRVTRGGTKGGMSSPPSVLAKLDDGDLKAALRSAEAKRDAQAAQIEAARMRLTAGEAQVASSRICMGEAQRGWGRSRQLLDTKILSQEAADEAHCKYDRLTAEHDAAVRNYAASQADLTVAQQNLRAAEADVERARVALAGATLTSPIDGIVTRVNVKVGEVVTGTMNNPGTVLMEVADMDQLVLVARVDEESIGRVKAGQKAAVHLKGLRSEVFAGTVQKVALASTEEKDGTRYFKAEISLDTGGRQVPAGLSGTARLDSAAHE